MSTGESVSYKIIERDYGIFVYGNYGDNNRSVVVGTYV